MKSPPPITSIKTVRNSKFPKLLWILLEADDKVHGVGETSYGPGAVEAFVHEEVADYLLGKDATQLDKHWTRITRLGPTGRARGAEIRALSAIDMALWDMQAKRHNIPLYELLGGLTRDRIRVYNTCAGYSYGVNRPGHVVPGDIDFHREKPYEDQKAFIEHPAELAESLLAEGYTAMKIWPFDQFVPGSDGQFISAAQLTQGAEPFRLIRERVQDKIDIMLELHSLWNLPSALRIADQVKPYKPFWVEDPVPMDSPDALAHFTRQAGVNTTASETLATRWTFKDLMIRNAMTICMLDVSWVGGISEAKRIAAMADAFHMPVAPHDCVGPFTLIFSLHLSLNAPNALIQEMVRAHFSGWYREIATALPIVEQGFMRAPVANGCGASLNQSFLDDPQTKIKSSGI